MDTLVSLSDIAVNVVLLVYGLVIVPLIIFRKTIWD